MTSVYQGVSGCQPAPYVLNVFGEVVDEGGSSPPSFDGSRARCELDDRSSSRAATARWPKQQAHWNAA